MATFKFLDINGVSTLLNQLKNTFVKKTDVENSFSDVSTNPVQNKIIKAALDDKVDKVDGKQLSTEDFTTEFKTKLDGIDPDATKITIDEELSSTSTNPVQNKIINAALGEKVPTANVTSTISSADGSKIPTSQAVIDYVEENGGGGGGGSIAIAEDIPVTLLSTGWTGDSAPYSQQVTVLDMREGMTPLIFLQGQATDEQIYAYNLITDYQAGNGTITFYVAETPEVDIPIVLKGVPAQEIGYMDNTILVPVTASGFSLSESTGRYEQTITVSGMTAGLGGSWDIARSGEVLSEEESKIAASITDVIRQTDAIKIVCLEMPEQDYTIVLSGTFKDVAEGDIVLSDVGELIDKVNAIEENTADVYTEKTYSSGDYCIYNNVLYKANQNIDVAEEFTPDHWTETTIGTELKAQSDSISELNAKNLNVDITPASGISDVYEYFRYSTIGNLCIVDIGGIIFSSSGLSQEATGSDIPRAKTRPLGILTTDLTQTSEPGNATLIYGFINTPGLVCHVPSGMEGKKLYGQVVYAIS